MLNPHRTMWGLSNIIIYAHLSHTCIPGYIALGYTVYLFAVAQPMHNRGLHQFIFLTYDMNIIATVFRLCKLRNNKGPSPF